MESCWNGETAHQRFWRSLLNTRLDQLLSNEDDLKSLRFNWKKFTCLKEQLKLVLTERGLDLAQLVAKACDENWDSEDDEKQPKKCSPVKVKVPANAVRVGSARQSSVRERESEGNELQAGDDCCEIDLQKRRCIEARLRRFAQN